MTLVGLCGASQGLLFWWRAGLLCWWALCVLPCGCFHHGSRCLVGDLCRLTVIWVNQRFSSFFCVPVPGLCSFLHITHACTHASHTGLHEDLAIESHLFVLAALPGDILSLRLVVPAGACARQGLAW